MIGLISVTGDLDSRKGRRNPPDPVALALTTRDDKAEAANLVIDGGRTLAEVERNIGCHEVTSGNWAKKARKEKEESADSNVPLDESERMELIRLRAESKEKDAALAHARMQVEFAKK